MSKIERNRRLIAVVTVKGNQAVQSFGYRRYLPMGNPKVIMENFDRWGADEIFLNCVDRGERGPNLDLLSEISKAGITTPVIYAGGIRSEKDAVDAVGKGADRIAVDAGWRCSPNEVASIHQGIGAQAVIASVPVRISNQELLYYDYENRREGALPHALTSALEADHVSEVMVVDWSSEGTSTPFDIRLLNYFPTKKPQLIAFGGICNPGVAVDALANPKCVAVGVGNFLSYREHAIQFYKSAMQSLSVRQPQYYPFRTEQPIHAADL